MCYEPDIFNIAKDHPRRYVLSTGGEVDAGRGVTTPGVALYHEGLDLIAIVSKLYSEVQVAEIGCELTQPLPANIASRSV